MSWLVPTATPRQLRIWRIGAGAVATIYLIVRAMPIVQRSGEFAGIGVLWWLDEPLGQPTLWVVWALAVGALGLFTFGRATQVTGMVGALAMAGLLTHRSSFGQILWFDIVMVLHLLVLAVAHLPRPGTATRGETAGWAIRLAALISATTYVVSAITKLQVSGLGWVSDGALESHIAFTATRAEVLGAQASPVASSLIDLGIASAPLAITALILELAAPLALLGRRFAWTWSVLMWGMHLTIAATMFIVFHWPLFGALFIPTILSASLGSGHHGEEGNDRSGASVLAVK